MKTLHKFSLQQSLGPFLCPICLGALEDPKNNNLFCKLCSSIFTKAENPCAQCAKPIPLISTPCQTKLARSGACNPNSSKLCRKCQIKHDPNLIVFCLYAYQYPFKEVIKQIKFSNAYTLARSMGSLLGRNFLEQDIDIPDVLIPVPLHKNRLFFRGYNQALEIAKGIRSISHIPIDPLACKKTAKTPAQTSLPFKARQKERSDIFSVETKQSYRHIALVDDVITSMATLASLRKSLEKENTGKIRFTFLALARTL